MHVLQKIKADPRTSKIPVVILNSSKEQREIANSFILKPVVVNGFVKAMQEAGMSDCSLMNHADGNPMD